MTEATAPRSIVIVSPWARRLGGAESMLFVLLKHLDRSKVDPVHIVFLEDGPMREEAAAIGYRASAIPTTRLRDPVNYARTVRRLRRTLTHEQPDLILSWMAKAHLYAAPAAAAAGLRGRCIWWQHLVPRRHWLDVLATALPTRAIGASSRAVATAQRALRPRRPTFVVHPGVELSNQHDDVESREQVRARLGIDDDAFVVLIAGRLQPWKGQHHLLRATALLRRQGVNAAALIVGDEAFGRSPGFAVELVRLADQLGLTDFTHFTGHVSDPTVYLRASDVCVNASDGEPFGIVLIEAMAAGLPVVAVDRYGPADIVVDGTTGLLVRSPAPDDLAQALERLARDRELGVRLGAAGRLRADQEFSAAAMAANFARAIREL